MKLLRIFTILLSAFCFSAISAQEQEKEYNFDFIWGVDAETVFDNREGDQTYSPQQTIFFSRLSPSLGVRFGKSEYEKINNDGIKKKYTDVHKLVAGTHYIQPIGIGYKENKFVPTAYYTFSHKVVKEVKRDSSVLRIDGTNTPDFKVWSVSFGMIPRRLSYRLPEILWSDSMDYYNPNIRGILLQCTKNNLAFHEISLDWRSLQSADQREAFNVNYNVRKYFHRYLRGISPFFIGGNVQLNHLAKRNPAPEGEGVNDDMFAYPYIGWDFSDETVFDRFRIRAGYAVSFDRCRAIGDWEVDGGLLADLHLLWKKIGIIETLYAGNKQFPLYPMYGSLLNMGDPHYQSSFYSLTSIYSPIVHNRHVSFGAFLDFHVTKEGTSCYQRVVLNVNLGNVDN
ncbi:MAG: hypothetical protein U0K66_03335 [Paludibacteraceae bacterium]|nr:hypothetical protein [Paludibacteraceae bacterium]